MKVITDYEKTILAGMLKDTEYITRATDVLKPEYFTGIAKSIYQIIVGYLAKSKAIISKKIFKDMLIKQKDLSEEKRAEIEIFFVELTNYTFTKDEFEYAINSLIRLRRCENLEKALTKAATDVNETNLITVEQHLKEALHDLESYSSHEASKGNIRQIALDSTWKRYQQSKTGQRERFLSGILAVDDLTGGGRRGEFWMWAAFTGEGKTQFAANFAYNVCANQGKNVVVITLEQSMSEYEDMIATRHSRKYSGNGLLYSEVINQTLSKEDEGVLKKTLEDWHTNKNYGIFHVYAPTGDATLVDITAELTHLQSKFDIGMVVIDYLTLIHPIRKRREHREELAEIFRDTKQLARNFDRQRGVFILALHQINRVGKERAEKKGYYSLGDLADTSAAERNADLVGWFLQTGEMDRITGIESETKAGISKYRKGRRLNSFSVRTDFSTCFISDLDEESIQL